MKELNITANNPTEEIIKDYLEKNASETLIDKINNGVPVEKDGKTLINKKDLSGFMAYATEEARKQAGANARSACVEDSVVFGWAIHYFEEDSIEGTLYNEDGTKYQKSKTVPKTKTESKTTQQAVVAPVSSPKVTKKQVQPEKLQMSLFDLLGGDSSEN